MNYLFVSLFFLITLFPLMVNANGDLCKEEDLLGPINEYNVTDLELEELTRQALASPSLERYSKVIGCDGRTLAHALAFNENIDWNTNDFKVLSLKSTEEGYSVAATLAYRNKLKVTDEKTLRLRDEYGNTVAHILAQKGKLNNFSKKILTMANEEGYLVVDKLVFSKSFNITDKNILMLRDKHGNTVYHHLARWRHDYNYYDESILKLRNNFGVTVAHAIASNQLLDWIPKNKDILKWSDNSGTTVAHSLARTNERFVTYDMGILRLRDRFGVSVASLLATFNPNFLPLDNKEILTMKATLTMTRSEVIAFTLLRNNPNFLPQDRFILQLREHITGSTLAHELAKSNRKWVTTDPLILELEDGQGNTVEDILKWRA